MNNRKRLLGFVGTVGAIALGASGAGAQMTPGTTAQGGATGGATAPSTSPAPAMGGAATDGTATTGGAATSGGVSQGATVYDTQGGTVGTIDSVQGEYVTLATTKNKVRLPRSSFANGPKGPLIAMTAAQIDQEAAKAGGGATTTGTTAGGGAMSQDSTSSAKPNVATGAAVTDTSGASVGKISDVKGDLATLELTSGSKVQVPANSFGAGPNGGLVIAMTAAQLSAAASAAGGGTSSSTTAGDGATSSGKTKSKKGG